MARNVDNNPAYASVDLGNAVVTKDGLEVPGDTNDRQTAARLGQHLADTFGAKSFEIEETSSQGSSGTTHFFDERKWRMCNWTPTGDKARKFHD